MYYGNAAAASQQDAANVWDTNFKGVWHVKEATGATNVDSTVNANNGTPTNGPASTTGKIDGALSFDGVNDYVTAGDTASLSTGDIDFTITAWFYMNSKAVSGNRNVIVSKWDNSGGAQQEYLLNYDNGSDRLAFEVKGTTANAINTGSPLIGTWYFVAGRHDAASDAISIFINGLLDTSVACVNCGQDTAHPFEIGRPGANANFFHGLIDEVRMSKVARSAAWIQTQYNNQDSPATFYIVSGEERPFEVRYTVCKNLAVSNCDATAEFTKADGTAAGYDTGATVVETASYPSLSSHLPRSRDCRTPGLSSAHGPPITGHSRRDPLDGARLAPALHRRSRVPATFIRGIGRYKVYRQELCAATSRRRPACRARFLA